MKLLLTKYDQQQYDEGKQVVTSTREPLPSVRNIFEWVEVPDADIVHHINDTVYIRKSTKPNTDPKTIDEVLEEMERCIDVWSKDASVAETHTDQMNYISKVLAMQSAKYLVERLKENFEK